MSSYFDSSYSQKNCRNPLAFLEVMKWKISPRGRWAKLERHILPCISSARVSGEPCTEISKEPLKLQQVIACQRALQNGEMDRKALCGGNQHFYAWKKLGYSTLWIPDQKICKHHA